MNSKVNIDDSYLTFHIITVNSTIHPAAASYQKVMAAAASSSIKSFILSGILLNPWTEISNAQMSDIKMHCPETLGLVNLSFLSLFDFY